MSHKNLWRSLALYRGGYILLKNAYKYLIKGYYEN